MCGIALILSGIRINLSSLFPNTAIQSPVLEDDRGLFSIDDIKAALQRRGPDSLGCKYIFLNTDGSSDFDRGTMLSSVEVDDLTKRTVEHCGQMCECLAKTNGVSHRTNKAMLGNKFFGQCSLVGATLQLRGAYRITQPLVDTCGNILVYNGEIFGGIHVSTDSNDAEVLMQSLRNCCNCISHESGRECPCNKNGKTSVPELLSTIKGPWALIYWQESSKTIWFGRDALGRRSLLVHWPSSKDPRLLLSSVSPYSSIYESSDNGGEDGGRGISFWDELPCAVYSLSLCTSERDGHLTGEVRKHNWTDPMLEELVKWERISVEPNQEKLNVSHEKLHGEQSMLIASSSNISPEIEHKQASILVPPSHAVLVALRESVRRRTALSISHQMSTHGCIREDNSPVAVLFSGGLDSMILAALLDECLDAKCEIDLVNVSFDGESAPDRISARAGLKELRRVSSFRRWKLIEIDADLSKLALETKHVMSLIDPAKTYMDLNIGMALWLAAGGNGWLNEGTGGREDQRIKYKSKSRVLLVGSGADEQCAGYGRYKTKYRQSSWIGLHEEMKLDMQRIWKRNLGRDDRCIADNGKEARFPFLDEDVIRTLLNIPLWEIADLDQPSGIGDKKILRDVARILGLHEAALLPKRAIQFGSRIARESNKKNFGSNRAANQASAGSAVINMSSNSS